MSGIRAAFDRVCHWFEHITTDDWLRKWNAETEASNRKTAMLNEQGTRERQRKSLGEEVARSLAEARKRDRSKGSL